MIPNISLSIEDLMIAGRLKNWKEKDEIEVKAIKANGINVSHLFIVANLNCKECEISIPCLPQDLIKEILIIKTILERNDAMDREATLPTRINEYKSFCKNFPDFEIKIIPLETNIITKKLIDFDPNIFLQPVLIPEANKFWCQIL